MRTFAEFTPRGQTTLLRHTLCLVTCLSLMDVQALASEKRLLNGEWGRNGLVSQRFLISGTEDRSNPLKQQLREPFTGDELFVRFRIRYPEQYIDQPDDDEGEFFVLWLDDVDGGNANTHSGGVPNLGIHVSGKQNRFMARYTSGGDRFGRELLGDRDFLVVGRLWKSTPGPKEPFNQFDLWVDPKSDQELSPDASVQSANAIHRVNWIGFSTGRKTEIDDQIIVWDIELAETWWEILELSEAPLSPSATETAAAPRTVSFVEDVFPILKARCFECHSGDDPESEIRLDIWDEVINQTSPRNAASSRLYEVIRDSEMPPDGNALTSREKEVLRAWIEEGLDWDEQKLPTPRPTSDHWSFQPIRRPKIPPIQNANWVRTPVDAFIARKHEALEISPSPEASAELLTRRLALDLTGLPPSAFDSTMTADDLLDDPAYGPRWGRHWLDVARWAESNGHQHNRDRPHAWRYRDWVVNAFNDNMPYDQFLREQIAGDEIASADTGPIIATGFLSAARYSGNELDKEIQRNDILVDVVNTTANAFLGLTMECAQCHTHKFDPISIRDYYRFQAFFAHGQPGNVILNKEDAAVQLIDERWQIFNTVHDRLWNVKRKQGHPEPIYILPKSVVAGMNPTERKRFQELEKQITEYPQSWSFYSFSNSGVDHQIAPHEMRWPLPYAKTVLANVQTHLLIRGDVKSPGPDVQPGWPALFGQTPDGIGDSRSALADWMTDSQHPLTARVWVNRLWQWHFGQGLVETSGDFGTQGTEPSHPELLDYLASELIESGWDTKHIQRLIVNSSTYRQSSAFSPENAAIDPENRTYWRWTPRRLESEAVRDSILSVGNLLDQALGGSSVPSSSFRRSLYLKQKRDDLPHQQDLFDGVDGLVSCSRRRVSTTALQPLWLLNSSLMHQAASALANATGSVETAFQKCLGRHAEESELKPLKDLADQYGLESACLAIMNLNEFVYIP